jgi:hypothetical protein
VISTVSRTTVSHDPTNPAPSAGCGESRRIRKRVSRRNPRLPPLVDRKFAQSDSIRGRRCRACPQAPPDETPRGNGHEQARNNKQQHCSDHGAHEWQRIAVSRTLCASSTTQTVVDRATDSRTGNARFGSRRARALWRRIRRCIFAGYPLWHCAATGKADLAELLLQRGANPKCPRRLQWHADVCGAQLSPTGTGRIAAAI